jgi:hypothetical protein
MRYKLLFILGIVAAHSALAAAWVQQESPHMRASVGASCVSAPDIALPDFTPHSEIYAFTFMRTDSLNEVMQP